MDSIDEIRRSRARWRATFGVLAFISLLAIGTLGYAIVDQGVTLAYQEDSFRQTERSLAVLRELAPALGRRDTRAELLSFLRRGHPTALITATDSTVGIEDLVFRFGDDGRLTAVGRLNE